MKAVLPEAVTEINSDLDNEKTNVHTNQVSCHVVERVTVVKRVYF